MELIIQKTDLLTSNIEVITTHKGENIIWNTGSLYKDSVNSSFDVFEHINAYWKQLKENEADAIFESYKDLRRAFDDLTVDRNQLTVKLYNLAAQLLDHYNLEDIKHWMLFHSNIYIPDSSVFKIEYIPSPDRPSTREQTYLNSDYVKLVVMTIVLRSMIPIWGEFISRTREEAGTNFKEFYAFRLISKSQVMNCEAMEKLRTYVQFTTANEKNRPAAVIGGVSSEDFPEWMLSLMVVRRLCVGDIRGIGLPATIITYIHKYISDKVKAVDNSFNGNRGMIKEKNFDELSPDGEKSLSRLEGYKHKQDIPSGDIVLLEHSASDYLSIAKRLAPGIDMKLVTNAVKTARALNTKQITEPQIILLQWIMKSIISTRGICYLSKTTVINLLGVAQAVLWHYNHKELAALITATPVLDNTELQIIEIDSYSRIPKEITEELNRLFPYHRRPTGKQKTLKLINPVAASIESITDLLTSSIWFLNLDEKFLKDITGGVAQRRYTTPYNIKHKLAVLILQIARRA